MAQPARTGIAISEAWIVATAPGATTASLYMSLTSTAGDTLRGVASTVAAHATILQMLLHGGQGGLRPMPEGLFIGRGQTIEMRPGNLQIRMEGLQHGLAAGDSVPVVLTFARAGNIDLAVTVEAAP